MTPFKSVNCRLTNDRKKGNTNSHLGERKTTFLRVCSSPCHYPNWKTWNRSVINFTHSWAIVNFSSLIMLKSCLKKHSPPHKDKLSWANKCRKRYLQFAKQSKICTFKDFASPRCWKPVDYLHFETQGEIDQILQRGVFPSNLTELWIEIICKHFSSLSDPFVLLLAAVWKSYLHYFDFHFHGKSMNYSTQH